MANAHTPTVDLHVRRLSEAGADWCARMRCMSRSIDTMNRNDFLSNSFLFRGDAVNLIADKEKEYAKYQMLDWAVYLRT